MRHVLRICLFGLACALLSVSVPVLKAPVAAFACSNPGCVVTTTSPSQIETYVSPITVTGATATFAERATTAQTTAITLPGTLSFTILDGRGNNEGFVAAVTASSFTSALFPLLPITNTAIMVAGTPSVTAMCYGPYGCGPGVGLSSSVGATLGTNPPVAVECPVNSIGEGQYAVSVPLDLSVTGLTAEKLGSYPASYLGSFTVSVTEGQPLSSFAGFGCSVGP